MLFDSKSMQKLRQKYSTTSSYYVPVVLQLDRADGLEVERIYLDGLVKDAPENIKKRWIKEFASSDNAQHLGTWFEIMLFGWFRKFCDPIIEPKKEGNLPDFSLNLGGREVFIEAKIHPVSEEERQRDNRIQEIFSLLDNIRRKYAIEIMRYKIGKKLNAQQFVQKVIEWIDEDPGSFLIYSDNKGNEIVLKATYFSSLENIVVSSSGEAQWINPEPIKKPLRKKASQHSQLRRAGHPYIIALLLEPWLYSAEEVVIAWLGNTQYSIDINTRKVVDQKIDRSGIHFWGNDILHRTVSGTLVFKSEFTNTRREFQAWFIQNPYALVQVRHEVFPVISSYIVRESTPQSFRMGWVENKTIGVYK